MVIFRRDVYGLRKSPRANYYGAVCQIAPLRGIYGERISASWQAMSFFESGYPLRVKVGKSASLRDIVEAGCPPRDNYTKTAPLRIDFSGAVGTVKRGSPRSSSIHSFGHSCVLRSMTYGLKCEKATDFHVRKCSECGRTWKSKCNIVLEKQVVKKVLESCTRHIIRACSIT